MVSECVWRLKTRSCPLHEMTKLVSVISSLKFFNFFCLFLFSILVEGWPRSYFSHAILMRNVTAPWKYLHFRSRLTIFVSCPSRKIIKHFHLENLWKARISFISGLRLSRVFLEMKGQLLIVFWGIWHFYFQHWLWSGGSQVWTKFRNR